MSSLEKALDILALLSRNRPVLRVAEAGRQTKLPKSSVSRLLQAMGRVGLLERTVNGGYVVGPLSLRLAELYRGQHSLLVWIDGALERLVEEFGFTGYAASLFGTEIVLLRVRQGAYPLRYVREIGARLSAVSTVMGRALLARLNEADLRAQLGDGPEDSEHAALRERLDQVRRERVAVAPSEFAEGITTLGCAFAANGESPIAMALAFPDSAVDAARRETMLAAIWREAHEVGREAGDPEWADPNATASGSIRNFVCGGTLGLKGPCHAPLQSPCDC
ncbi:MAG: IclR family transcriptional regulator [Acetobacteraceae bacterium]